MRDEPVHRHPASAQEAEGLAQLDGRRRIRGRQRELAMIEAGQGERQALAVSAREAVELAAVANPLGGPWQERRTAGGEHHEVRASAVRGLADRLIEVSLRVENPRACSTSEDTAGRYQIGAEDGAAAQCECLDEQA